MRFFIGLIFSIMSVIASEYRIINLCDQNSQTTSLFVKHFEANHPTSIVLLPQTTLYTPFFSSIALKMNWVQAVLIPFDKLTKVFPFLSKESKKTLLERLSERSLHIVFESSEGICIAKNESFSKLSSEQLSFFQSFTSTQVALNP